MPLYEYDCNSCGRRFEMYRSMDDRNSASCPDCGNPAQLRISLSSFQLAVPLSLFTHDGKRLERRSSGGEVPDTRPPTKNLREV